MSKKQNQKKKLNKIGFTVLANVIIVFILVIGFGREYLSNLQVEKEIQDLENKYAELQEEKLSTLDLINELSSEYYLEQQARTKHGLSKNGEEVLIIRNSEEDQILENQKDSILDSIAPEGIGNPLRWYYYFFDKGRFEELQDL